MEKQRNWDEAVLLRGKDILRKKILKINKGSLARIFKDADYKRVFPEASTVFEAVKLTKEIYSDAEEFMAFELEPFV